MIPMNDIHVRQGRRAGPRASACLALALALALTSWHRTCPPLAAEDRNGGSQLPAWKAAVSLESSGRLSATFRLGGGEGLVLLDLDAKGEGAAVHGGLEAGAFSLGPARLSGVAAFFSEPAAYGLSRLGARALCLDTGLSSSLAMLALGDAGFEAFALCSDGGTGLVAGLPGLSGSAASMPGKTLPGNCGTGLAGRLGMGGGVLSFLAAVSRSAPSEPGQSWRLEDAYDPGGGGFLAGLAAASREGSWDSSFGLALSWGPLRGQGIAARLESALLEGPFTLSLAAGFASEAYRDILGEMPERGCGLALGCRVALREAARLDASVHLSSLPFSRPVPGREGADSPAFARPLLDEWLASLALSCPVGRAGPKEAGGRGASIEGGDERTLLRLGCSFGLEADGEAFLLPAIDFSCLASASALKLHFEGRWKRDGGADPGPPSIKASLSASSPSSSSPALHASLALDIGADRKASLDAGLGISAAIHGGARLSLEASWKGLSLAPASAEDVPCLPILVLRYSLARPAQR